MRNDDVDRLSREARERSAEIELLTSAVNERNDEIERLNGEAKDRNPEIDGSRARRKSAAPRSSCSRTPSTSATRDRPAHRRGQRARAEIQLLTTAVKDRNAEIERRTNDAAEPADRDRAADRRRQGLRCRDRAARGRRATSPGAGERDSRPGSAASPSSQRSSMTSERPCPRATSSSSSWTGATSSIESDGPPPSLNTVARAAAVLRGRVRRHAAGALAATGRRARVHLRPARLRRWASRASRDGGRRCRRDDTQREWYSPLGAAESSAATRSAMTCESRWADAEQAARRRSTVWIA